MDVISMIMGAVVSSILWIAISTARAKPEPCAREHVDD